jgi:hypothetical protein
MDQTVIDSKTRELTPPEIILEALKGADLDGLTPQVAAIAIMSELGMPEVDAVQFGNTVFIGHRGKGEEKDLMWGRALNVDTAQNFVANGLQYLGHLQEIGVRRYVTDYEGDELDNAFRAWKRYADRADTQIAVGRLEDGSSRAFITLGELPLTTES